MEDSSFENIETYGPGTLLFLQKSELILKNCFFNHTFSKTYFIYSQDFSNISIIDNKFSNIFGNIFFLSQTTISARNNYFEDCLCVYDLGCVFYLKLSLFWGLNNFIKNVSNINSGGSYYIENSNLYLNNEILSDSHSDNYAACLLARNSSITLEKFFAYNFSYGCLNFFNSSIIALNLSLENFNENLFKSTQGCASSFCSTESLILIIKKSNFIGNRNFDKGGVIFFSLIINY